MTTVPPLVEAIERQSGNQPDEVALIDDREQVTWAEFARRVAASAAGLEKLGLEPGERIGIHGLNSIELAVTILGCWRRGLITVLLTPGSKDAEVQQELAATGAVAYLGDEDLYPIGQTAIRDCPALRLALVLNRGALLPDVVERLSGKGAGATEPTHPRDLAAILFSSGTTGIPKGVMHTHASLAALGRLVEGLSEYCSKALIAPPLSYIPSLHVLAQIVYGGHTAVLLRRFEPELLLDTIAAQRCTLFCGLPPAAYQAILAAQQARPRDTSCVRWWAGGGDAFPTRLLTACSSLLGGPMLQGYGMTELFPATANRPTRNRPGSLGELWPGVEARIMDAQGSPCEVGETGEMQLRGPDLFVGYWDDPQTTARVMRDGWLCTGDRIERDGDGYFWFRGRLKQIITCDGEKISPQHVENALLEHPDVLEAGVIGRAHELHGEVPVAFVRLRPRTQATPAELRAFTQVRVEDCGVPEDIILVEALPRGRTGKVDRQRLREMLTTPTQAGSH